MRLPRGQAAAEFLMTYGWAVVVVLTVLAVLFYAGVFNAQGSSPSSCVLPAGFTCNEFRLDDDGNLYLDLGQATGKAVTVNAIGCSASANPALTDSVNVSIRTGGHAVVTGAGVPCLNSSGTAFKGKVVIQYTVAGSGLARTISATLSSPMAGTATGSGYGSDLVLLLHFDNNTVMGENATNALDSSNYANNGTARNGTQVCGDQPACPNRVSGKIGLAMQFDGVNDNVLVPATPCNSFANSTSLSFWMNVRSLPTDYSGPFRYGSGGGDGWIVYINDASLVCVFKIGNTTLTRDAYGGTTAVTLNTWNHLAFVYDKTNHTFKRYVNGTLAQTTNTTVTSIPDMSAYNQSLQIGVADGSEYFNGTVDEVRIYGRAISDAEVLALYQAGG